MTQSGTAESFAHILAKEIKRYGMNAQVVDVQNYEEKELDQERFLVVLCATYGEGEPTDSGMEFMKGVMAREEHAQQEQGVRKWLAPLHTSIHLVHQQPPRKKILP